VGTRTYASPEQLDGSIALTAATDLYAAGIILLEMFTVFGTAMERARVLADARQHSLPKGINAGWILLLSST
jgi:serine/threonine protein kinase